MIKNNLKPIIYKDTKIVILGTFPSVKSREAWYYHNPKNQFWAIMSLIFNDKSILTTNEYCNNADLINSRKIFLKNKQIGLWDMIESCEIDASRDNSIKNPKYNNIAALMKKCPNLKYIAFSSKKAFFYYKDYLKKSIKDKNIELWLKHMTNNGENILPSPSSANARLNLKEKVCKWKNILQIYE